MAAEARMTKLAEVQIEVIPDRRIPTKCEKVRNMHTGWKVH